MPISRVRTWSVVENTDRDLTEEKCHFLSLSFFFSLSCCSVNKLCPTLGNPTRLPCPSLSPGTFSNSCPLSPWCHPTISSSVVPFSSCLQCFPTSESVPMSQFFASGGQNSGASASASVQPMNIQGWFLLSRIKLKNLLTFKWSCQGTTILLELVVFRANWLKGLRCFRGYTQTSGSPPPGVPRTHLSP